MIIPDSPSQEEKNKGERDPALQIDTLLLIDSLIEVSKEQDTDFVELQQIFYNDKKELRTDFATVFNDLAEYCIERSIDLDAIIDSLEFPDADESFDLDS